MSSTHKQHTQTIDPSWSKRNHDSTSKCITFGIEGLIGSNIAYHQQTLGSKSSERKCLERLKNSFSMSLIPEYCTSDRTWTVCSEGAGVETQTKHRVTRKRSIWLSHVCRGIVVKIHIFRVLELRTVRCRMMMNTIPANSTEARVRLMNAI